MLTSHPTDARYFASRSAARDNCRHGERVIRLGSFAWGSFGCYGPLKPNGIPVGASAGGAPPNIIVWMVTAKA